MADKTITIRVQAREGTKRLQLSPASNLTSLFENIHDAFGYTSYMYNVHKDRQKQQQLNSSKSKTLSQAGIKHGDMLFVSPLPGAVLTTASNSDVGEPMQTENYGFGSSGTSLNQSGPSPSTSAHANMQRQDSTTSITNVQVSTPDEVDIRLASQDGLIKRGKDSKMCRHGDKGCCVFCAPLEPFDEAYLKEHKIKHMSFHSYLKKLTSGVDKGKFVALEDLTVKIKEGCTSHLPWPKGICSKCQPSAVTLNRQTYRHVDNVMFENAQIVDNFLSYWRNTGNQRFGFLIGKYEEHLDVPLGIRARVAAIYEPPQESTKDSINFMLHNEKEEILTMVCTALGLKKVGWVCTDLIPQDLSKGTVKYTRGIQSYFLSAQECITAAYFQNMYPNPCHLSPKMGYFGSKFATVVITGDESNQVHMVGYQVSNQCMALVRDNVLVPTNSPEFGYVKESTEQQYVPDVYYKEKDEYGNEVTRLCRPLPVEYLLVDVPVATPKEPLSTFTNRVGVTPFPIENRFVNGHIQDFNSLATYLNQFPKGTPFLQVASDFHFLLYIASMDIVPIREYIGPLLEAIRDQNESKANDWAKSEHWATVEQLILSGAGSGPQTSIPSQDSWTCDHCTFINQSNSANCEVCQLPRH